MSNNIFYKALAAVSTVGIVVIAGIQVTTALKKGNTAVDQLAKTMLEIKNVRKEALDEVKSIRAELSKERKDALTEVKSVRSEVLQELNSLSSEALGKVETVQKSALSEVKTIRSDVLKELDSIRSNTLNEIKTDRSNALIQVKAAREEALKKINQGSSPKPDKVWLLLRFGSATHAAAFEKIPMLDMSQCEMQGSIFTGSKRLHPDDYRGFECLESE